MRKQNCGNHPRIGDYGGKPFIFNINHAASMNNNFRTVIWTGQNMQITLMSIPPHSDIGVEMHTDVDQFIRIVSGRATVYLGHSPCELTAKASASKNDAILIPAGAWHNIINEGSHTLKLYSLYAPQQHPFGTVHRTKADAQH